MKRMNSNGSGRCMVSGFSISFMLHAVMFTLVVVLGNFALPQSKPLVIDFSITEAKPFAAISSAVRKKIPDVNPIVKQDFAKNPQEQKKLLPAEVVAPLPEIAAKKEPEPVQQIPEKIAIVQEEILKPQQEVVAVKSAVVVRAATPPVHNAVGLVATTSNHSNLPTETAGGSVTGDRNAKGTTGTDPVDSGPHDQQLRYIKAHFEYIRNIIQSKIIYPQVARKNEWQGRVVVSFVVCVDGSVEDIHIRESSGYSLLDMNVIQTVRKAAPFPAPPVRAELRVPICYNLV